MEVEDYLELTEDYVIANEDIVKLKITPLLTFVGSGVFSPVIPH